MDEAISTNGDPGRGHGASPPTGPLPDAEARQAEAARWRLLVLASEGGMEASLRSLEQQQQAVCVQAASPDDAMAALRAAGKGGFDLVLADATRPHGAGWELLRRLRQEERDMALVLVSATPSQQDLVFALREGADDFVPYPFDLEELAARIGAVVRRWRSLPVLRSGQLRIDLARRSVRRGDLRVELSPREFDLLRVLAQGNGRVLTRQELYREIWGAEFDPGTGVIEVLVNRLRRKLDRAGECLIVTVPGHGYALAA